MCFVKCKELHKGNVFKSMSLKKIRGSFYKQNAVTLWGGKAEVGHSSLANWHTVAIPLSIAHFSSVSAFTEH